MHSGKRDGKGLVACGRECGSGSAMERQDDIFMTVCT
jgi:hypothetical protein